MRHLILCIACTIFLCGCGHVLYTLADEDEIVHLVEQLNEIGDDEMTLNTKAVIIDKALDNKALTSSLLAYLLENINDESLQIKMIHHHGNRLIDPDNIKKRIESSKIASESQQTLIDEFGAKGSKKFRLSAYLQIAGNRLVNNEYMNKHYSASSGYYTSDSGDADSSYNSYDYPYDYSYDNSYSNGTRVVGSNIVSQIDYSVCSRVLGQVRKLLGNNSIYAADAARIVDQIACCDAQEAVSVYLAPRLYDRENYIQLRDANDCYSGRNAVEDAL